MSIRVTDTLPTPTEFPSTLSNGYSAVSSGVFKPHCYRVYNAGSRRFVAVWERLLTVSHIPQDQPRSLVVRASG